MIAAWTTHLAIQCWNDVDLHLALQRCVLDAALKEQAYRDKYRLNSFRDRRRSRSYQSSRSASSTQSIL